MEYTYDDYNCSTDKDRTSSVEMASYSAMSL